MVPHAKSHSGPPVGAARKQERDEGMKRRPSRHVSSHAIASDTACRVVPCTAQCHASQWPSAMPRSGPVPCRAVAQCLPQLEARAELDAHRAQVLVRDEVQDAQLDLLAPEHLNLETKRMNERANRNKQPNKTTEHTNGRVLSSVAAAAARCE